MLPEPLYVGGSGSRSEQSVHPGFMPDRLEAGTPNAVGIAGLRAAIEHVKAIGIEAIAAHEQGLRERLVARLSELPGLRVFSGGLAVVSFTLAGMRPSDIGLRLDQEYGILTRVGLHCAPAAHGVLGTKPDGTVRISLGASSTVQEVDQIVAAVKAIART